MLGLINGMERNKQRKNESNGIYLVVPPCLYCAFCAILVLHVVKIRISLMSFISLSYLGSAPPILTFHHIFPRSCLILLFLYLASCVCLFILLGWRLLAFGCVLSLLKSGLCSSTHSSEACSSSDCSPCRQQRLIDLKLCSCSVDQVSGALCLSERGNSFELK